MVLYVDPATGLVVDGSLPTGTSTKVLALVAGLTEEVFVVSGGGSGSNPAGSSLTTEGTPGLKVITLDTAAVPSEAQSITVQAVDSVLTPTETAALKVLTSEAALTPADLFGPLTVITSDQAMTPTETSALTVTTTSSETSSTPVEGMGPLKVTAADTVSTPTGAHLITVNTGSTAVTQTVGTGFTTPTNAQGLADGTTTIASSNSTTAKTGTLVGTYVNILPSSGAVETQGGTVTLAWTYAVVIGVLCSASLSLAYSTNGGTSFTTLATITAAASTTTTSFTITGATLATLSQLQFKVVGSATGSALGGVASVALDAVVATFTATGNNPG